MIGFGQVVRRVQEVLKALLPQPHGHIGLPPAEPNIADQYVGELDRVLAGHGQLDGRGTGGKLREPYRPFPVGAGRGGLRHSPAVTVIFSPGSAVPHTGQAMSRCNTM